MAHQLEARIRQQMMHVASRPGVEIIDAQNLIAAFQQAIAKVRPNKSGSAGNEGTTFGQHGHTPGVAWDESTIRVSLVPSMSRQSACGEVPSSAVPRGLVRFWLTQPGLLSLGLTRRSRAVSPRREAAYENEV